MTTKKSSVKKKRVKSDPVICKKCKHNMGRSRCKYTFTGFVVRCNKCKSVYDIIISFPKEETKEV